MNQLKCQGCKEVRTINYRDIIKNTDKILLFIPLVFAVISIVMIGSTSYTDHFQFTRDVIIQAISYIIGAVLIFFVMLIDYELFADIPKLLYIMCIAAQFLVYTPLGIEQYGSRAWINLGITTVQPCEFVKIMFILFYAKYLTDHTYDLDNFKGLVKTVAVAMPIVGLIGIEDLGNALVLLFVIIIMIFAAGVDIRLYLKCAAASFAMLPIIYFLLKPHQRTRIDAFLHPNDVNLAGNYQVWNSKVAIGSGGFNGKGLFMGTQKSLDYLPVAKSDFIFSVIGEELGFIGGFLTIGVYVLFLYKIIRLGDNAKNLFGMLIVMGFGAMFFFQVFENIGMTMGVMPVTGITLPFVSSGGTSIIANMISLGLVLNVGSRSKVINF